VGGAERQLLLSTRAFRIYEQRDCVRVRYCLDNQPEALLVLNTIGINDGLDFATLGFIGKVPKATGCPDYAPADLLKLYIYGYLNGVRSSRRIEAEIHCNIEVIWLLRHPKLDFKTIADFRRCSRFATLQCDTESPSMISRRRALRLIGVGGIIAAADRSTYPGWIGRAKAADLDEVKIATPLAISDAPLLVAEHKGYCREVGIKTTMVSMQTGAYMVAPLGAGQLDIGAGATSAGLFNSATRGIGIKITADKGSNLPGYAYVSLLVRKELVDSGKFKTLKDLKGLRCAEPGKGASTGSTLNQAIEHAGLRYDDVVHVYNMGFPEMLTAMKNGAIDAAPVPEPFNTFGREQGIGVRFAADEFYPRQTVAVLLYGPEFIAKRREIAERCMVAYLKGVRFYNGAITDGRFAGPNAAELIDLLVRETRYKDPELYRKVVPNGCNPDGHVDRPSLEKDLAFYRAQKFVDNETVGVGDVVDGRFVDAALKTLGPYKPA
jgi:NitT/TauT family transport system substrate-binding protein